MATLGQDQAGEGAGQGNLCPQGAGLGSWAPAPDWRTALAFADLNGAQTAGIPGASLGLWPSQTPAQNWDPLSQSQCCGRDSVCVQACASGHVHLCT